MRLTTDSPSGFFQGLDNCFYIKDGKIMVRDGAEALGCDDISLHYDNILLLDFMKIIASNGFISVDLYACDDNSLDEAFGEMLLDGPTTQTGIMGLIYEMAKSLAKMRERLKEYEDTDMSPEEIHQAIVKQRSENSVVSTRQFTEMVVEGLSDEDIEKALQQGKEEAECTVAKIKSNVRTFNFQQKFNDDLIAMAQWHLLRDMTEVMKRQMLNRLTARLSDENIAKTMQNGDAERTIAKAKAKTARINSGQVFANI